MFTNRQYRWVALPCVFGVGLIVGWLARRPELAPVSDPATQVDGTARRAPPASLSPASRPPAETTPQSEEIASPASTTRNASSGPVELAPESSLPGGDLNSTLPSDVDIGALEPQEKQGLDDLMGAISISCQFGAGQGAAWRSNSYSLMGANWQGGLIVYDSMDFSASTARMTGNEGATGSPTGETNMRVAVTNNGLHFTSFNRRGDLVSTTIFPVTDKQGRYIAVMSTHSSEFNHYSSQFYGLCDSLP